MIKIKKSTLICFALLASSFYAVAQQDAQYSQYMFNTLVINPAYAGYKGDLNLSALHRSQWVGIDGAPKTQSLVLDGSFVNDKMGFALTVVNDRIGIQGQTNAYLNYAYKLKVSEEGTLAFGMGLGLAQFTLNTGDAHFNDPSDPNFNAGKLSFISPDAKAGLHFSTNKFYVGLSATNLFSKAIDYSTASKNLVIKQGQHIFFTAGYLVDVNDFLKFKPSFLIKEDTKGPTNLDINNFFLIGEKVWIGASYRTSVNLWKKNSTMGAVKASDAIVGLLEIYAGKRVRVGYAYDHSVSSLQGFDNGSHEISIGYTFGSKTEFSILSPRYF
ncbi:PorP/SprF family type IX secretion system membrane protein [Pedobacter arcticus]|uniref:PorP/SprF family type IX secretion system membrane protein n=1 Tax=Pedobacter arcticus TaxID=752140 RepID=UPI0002E37B9E|nr:type IX secretion system membrane protein PorP/SprF [Pedobacter arcticus]